MKKFNDQVSDDRVPPSDPSSGVPHAPGTMMTVGEQHIIHVENGRGEELQWHLASHGIDAIVSPGAETSFERVEIQATVNVDDIQAVLDEWQ